MKSLYDELSEKLANDSRRVGPRADIGLLLFANREALRDLWIAAEHNCSLDPARAQSSLHSAVERLRPLFGERVR